MLRIDTQHRIARIGEQKFPITLGRNGCIAAEVKREGDGCTPLGRYALGPLYYRPDRITLPGDLPWPGIAITPDLGWCDDPAHPLYNQPVPLPFAARHEKMWRDDHVYDVVMVIQYNTQPIIPERGSAIFLHLSHDHDPAATAAAAPRGAEASRRLSGHMRPTAGCVAMAREDLLAVLLLLQDPAWIEIF